MTLPIFQINLFGNQRQIIPIPPICLPLFRDHNNQQKYRLGDLSFDQDVCGDDVPFTI